MPVSNPHLEKQQALRTQLLGTWHLASYQIHFVPPKDGPAIEPYGAHTTGLITYTADGYVSMQFGSPGQAHHQSSIPKDSSEAELAESARRYMAYAGPFDVGTDEAGELVIVHHADVSLYPNWAGTHQRRRVSVKEEEGGKVLRLWPERPMVLQGEEIVPTMIWRKASAHDPITAAKL